MTFEARIQRTTIVLAIIAVALGAFIAFYERGTLSSGELAERRGRLLPRFVRARVDRVVIERDEGQVVLVREREDEDEVGEWMLVEPIEWPADLDAVDTLLGALEWASARRKLEGIDEADRARFGFDEPQLRASFTAADQEVPIVIGAEDALESGLYLTLDDETTAYVVGQDLLEALDHDAEHFRDRALLSRFGTGTVTAFEIEDAEGTIGIDKRDGRFFLAAPASGYASEPKVRELLRALGGLNATRFVDEAPEDLSSFGLDSPTRTVRLTKELEDAPDETLTLRFGGPCASDDQIHARVDEGPVVCVPITEALEVGVSDLREPRLLTTDESELERMTIEQGGRTLVVERDDEDFSFTLTAGDTRVDVDEAALADFMRDLRSVRATGYEPLGSSDPVAQPWLTLSLVGGDEDRVEEVRVGAPSATGLVAVRGDEPVYVTLPAEAEALLTITTLRFRSRRLIEDDAEEGRRLSVTRGGLTQEAARDGLFWKLSAPFEADAERPTVRDALRELASLEAVRFVAEAATPTHGLGALEATIVFETSDEDEGDGHEHDHGDEGDEDRPHSRSYTLELGAATDDGVFARLGDDPAVFVVTTAVADALGADFVSRGVLSTELDELAGLTVERQGLSVVLSKEDDGWHTADGGLADRERTRDLADRVAVIRASDVVSYGPPSAAFGLAAPRTRVTVRRNASASLPAEYTLLVGGEAAADGAPRSYVRREDLDVTFLVPTEAIELFTTYSP